MCLDQLWCAVTVERAIATRFANSLHTRAVRDEAARVAAVALHQHCLAAPVARVGCNNDKHKRV